MTTLQERCRIAEQCLPDAPYRAMLKNLHNEMLAALAQQGEPTHERVYETIIQWDEGGGKRSRRELTRRIEALYTAAPAPQPAQAKPCTAGAMCLDCQPRGTNGECPDATQPAPTQKPVAYITETEQGDMVWTPEMYCEACTYCDDGEFPIPLFKSVHGIKEVK